MIDWTWRKEGVSPQEILDAVKTLPMGSNWYEMDLISEWIGAECYLFWASECLERNDQFGLDAAVCYAKRAVCRQIDGLMIQNHLQAFVGCKYPRKAEMLRQVGLPVRGIVQDLIIDTRN